MSCGAVSLITFVLWLQDFYIWLVACGKKLAFAGLVKYRNLHTRTQTRVVAARLLGESDCANVNSDVTFETKLFYMFDRVLSCASMQRWLAGFGYGRAEQMRVVFLRGGALYMSHIDLDNDRDLDTGENIIDGDMTLSKLPSKMISDY